MPHSPTGYLWQRTGRGISYTWSCADCEKTTMGPRDMEADAIQHTKLTGHATRTERVTSEYFYPLRDT